MSFSTKNIYYTGYNFGHILIRNFILSSPVRFQMCYPSKVCITEFRTHSHKHLVLSSHVLLKMFLSTKVFITHATILTLLHKTLCFSFMCFNRCFCQQKFSSHMQQFRTFLHKTLCFFIMCFYKSFCQQSFHHTCNNFGHFCINFVLLSHPLLQMFLSTKVFIAHTTILDTFA